MGVETELKLRVSTRDLGALAKWRIPGSKARGRSEKLLVSTYYDTAKHKLRRHGISLRVRKDGEGFVQTVKSAVGAPLGRGEWETAVASDKPEIRKAGHTPLKQFGAKKLRRKLKPIFETSVHRTTVPIQTRGAEIEVAIDRGRIAAGDSSSPIEEVELELKSGRAGDLFRVARLVERRSKAEVYLTSKSERGYALTSGTADPVVFAQAVELQKHIPASEAFQAIALSAIRHFSGNADAVRRLDPEGVHQMRVGLRRLRAAISIFSKILATEATEDIKRELKWLTNRLAAAREIDVFVKERIKPLSGGAVPQRGRKALAKDFRSQRTNTLEHAKTAIAGERYRTLLIDVLEWVEVKYALRPQSDEPIETFATDVLRRRLKKARKKGRRLEDLSARERHKLRIGVKKLRYTVDFFESLFPKRRDQKRLRRLSKQLKQIQGALGKLNDFIAHRKMGRKAALKAPRENRRARAFTSGIILGREDRAARPLLQAATEEIRRLRGRDLPRKRTLIDRL